MAAYLLGRMPAASTDGEDTPIRNLLGRSFAAFRARKRNDEAWVESRIAAVFDARKSLEPAADQQWLEQVSGLTGVPLNLLNDLCAIFDNPEEFQTSQAAVDAIFAWLGSNPGALMELVRPENVDGLFGGSFAALQTDKAKGEFALPVISGMLRRWMAGLPLNKIEEAYPKGGDPKHCEYSRHFVLRLVPDLAFIAALPGRLLAARFAKDGAEPKIPTVIATLGAVVRAGCDSPETLVVKRLAGARVSRVAARARFAELAPHISAGDPYEDFETTRERVSTAATLVKFLNDDD